MNRFQLSVCCLIVMGLNGCNNKRTLFEQIPSSHSGIHFNNQIIENDSINPLDVVNIYNGGGVGIGDFNNDGLPDIYFTGNMVQNRLYLNKGDFKFDDITDKAGVNGSGRWGRGVSVIDINNDGLQDIYVCNTIYDDVIRRRNLLYVNKGVDKEGIPRFTDSAAAYGLDIHLQSTMASFFDYDNDGDLDMYLTVNEATSANNPNRFGSNSYKNSVSKGRLYRNDFDSSQMHIAFLDVSQSAGITLDGFGHGATIADINLDGWKDIYVSNDFLSDNILYINNHNGTFTNRSKEYFKHTSYNAMGQDIVDINNDGLADVVELDMSPEDNYRKKMMMNASNTTTIQNFDLYRHQYQYVRNTLQLNQGPRVEENDSLQSPIFSETSYLSGVAQTDWSWAPVVIDFDNDSYRDIIITNGFPKDVSDHDFMVYADNVNANTPKREIIKKIPQIKLRNYAYRNNGDVTFSNATFAWGLGMPAFSNGAAFADVDSNGTMDLIINNINDEALVYKNTSNKNDSANHYLQIKFKGDKNNVAGLGTWVDIYYDNGKHQTYENSPYRGYLSTMQNITHFGLGKTAVVDSVIVKWPNGKMQIIKRVKANQVLQVNIVDANHAYSWEQNNEAGASLFKEITKAAGIDYRHIDVNHIDFNIQTTLPHELSEYSPALAAADLNGDGSDDLVAGGNSLVPAQVFFQQKDGRFIKRTLVNDSAANKVDCEDAGILLFDANNDGATDVYIASGGYRFKANGPNYQDRLYINNGKGTFSRSNNAIPENHTSKLCVRAIDYNNDGKLDIFVSGRVEPWQYPKPVSSFIFRNDSDDKQIKFSDVSDEVAPDLKNIGMVCDALYTDFDNDNQRDLILTGEWMPVTFLKNIDGKFVNVTDKSGVSDKSGWWNAIVAGDFRHTGRMDYIVGNVGLNTFYQASDEHPVYITAKDFDGNGGYDAIPSLFLANRTGELKEFPAQGRDEVIERMPSMKKRFKDYRSFATATFDEIFPPENRKDGIRLKATMLQSCYLRNDGNGKFTMIPLPKQAQLSALNGMVADDFDEDGNLDVLINGNDFGTEVTIGRYDALNGLLLKGDGSGKFAPLTIKQSGIYIPGNGRALVTLKGNKDEVLVAASQNKAPVKLFKLNKQVVNAQISPTDISATIRYKNGSTEKREFYYGTSFLSQSSRFIKISDSVSSVDIVDNKGNHRTLQF
jgi:hypothetical protein